MSIFKIIGIAVAAAMAALALRAYRPEMSVQITIAAGVMILILALDDISALLGSIAALSNGLGIDEARIKTIFKVIGIAYLAQFAAGVCRDAGESALAYKVELAGRVMILMLALPLVSGVLEVVARLLGR